MWEDARSEFYSIKNGTPLELLYLPPARPLYARAPVLLSIHGGGWSGGKKIDELNGIAQAASILRDNGFAVIAIDYRLLSDAIRFGDIMQDCFDVCRWIAMNQDQYLLDPRRIVTCGGSAGGHLALLTAMLNPADYPGDPALACGDGFRFAGMINLYGPTECRPINGRYIFGDQNTYPYLFDADYEKNPEKFKAGSPIAHVCPNIPPVLCITGLCDDVVPPENSRLFKKACDDCGACCDYLEVENAWHCFVPVGDQPMKPSLEEIQQTIASFALRVIR